MLIISSILVKKTKKICSGAEYNYAPFNYLFNTNKNNCITNSTMRWSNVLFLPLFLLLFVSCKENENPLNYVPELGLLDTTVIIHDYTNAWNINNPYDSLGFIHNQALDYYALNSNPDTTFLSLNAALDYIDDVISPYFVLNNINNGTKTSRINNFDTNFIQAANIYSSPFEYIGAIYSTTLKNKITELFLVLSTHASDYSIVNICNEIKTKENEISISNVLTESEKEIFFKTSAILKFSSIYWIEVKNGDGASDYYEDFDTNPEIPGDANVCGPVTTAAVDAIAAGFGANSQVASLASVAFKASYEYLQTTTFGSFLPDLP